MSTDRPTGTQTRRRPTRAEVRRALLDAAATVFARRGIDAASVDDVAAAAGLTKGAVYSNFGSKDGLVEALLDDRLATYLEVGLDAVSDAEVPLAQRARALGDRLTTALDDEDWTLLFLELFQRTVRAGHGDSPFLTQRRELHAAIVGAITDVTGPQVVMPLSPDDVATLLLALSNGLAIERRAAPGAVPDDLLGRVLALVLTGTTTP